MPKSALNALKKRKARMCIFMDVFVRRRRRGHVLCQFWRNATCRSFDKQCSAQSHHMIPLPHPAQGMGKKADMFEGNVLVKKYRGGRRRLFQERFRIVMGFTSQHLYLF